jgi:hypothetical protein
MIRITNVFQRPTANVPFHNVNMTPELFEHIKTTYKDTGKLVTIEVTKSEDLLTQTAVWGWNTEEDYDAYLADPILQEWFEIVRDHNASNNITNVSKLKETI